MAKWWSTDMVDASQNLYGDPGMALEVATLPNAVLQGQQLGDPNVVRMTQEAARIQKGGFMDKIAGAIGLTKAALNKEGENIPGYETTKNIVHNVGQAVWWPVDKLASGAYWLYSNVVSQPLSTLLLQEGKVQISGDFSKAFDWDEWTDAYDKAEHISPGQAAANIGGVEGMKVRSGYGAFEKVDESKFRQAERFLYDSEYWRNKAGWKYTVGTGAADFAVSVGIAPEATVLKGGAAAVRGVKNIEIASKEARTLKALTKTPEEASRTNQMLDTYKWMNGKTGAEIAQHPMFGKGRRANPFAYQYGEVFSTTPETFRPIISRFQTGDTNAVREIAARNQDLTVQLGRMDENRRLLDSVRFDEDLLGHFMTEENAMRVAPHLPGRAGAGAIASSPYYTPPGSLSPQLVEPPFPRPIDPGPAQSGWDATYGHLAKEAEAYRAAAGEVLKARNAGLRQMFGGTSVGADDLLVANQWRTGRLQEINAQLDYLKAEQKGYQTLFGPEFGKPIDEVSPGTMNLFGTSKTLYRMGPLAKASSKQGDKAIVRASTGRGNWDQSSNLATRVVRNGFYRTPLRIVQSFGEKMPPGFINHNDTDAPSRVIDWLKQVRGLSPETRMAMASEYASQGDKVGRSNALKAMRGAIIHHYAESKGLDPEVARELNGLVQNGLDTQMLKLTGQHPTTQKFTSAPGVGLVEDGEGLIMAPHATTQLSQGDVMMDIRELERFIDRNSGHLQGFKKGMGSAKDLVGGLADNASKIWKASTLLRPGYTLRAVSEEAALSAVKFGLLSRLGEAGEGGLNFLRNRNSQVQALVGKGSYVPTTGKASASRNAIVRIEDPNALEIAEKHGLQSTKITVNKAWPLVESRISHERSEIARIDKRIAEGKARGEDVSGLEAQRLDHEDVIAEHADYAKAILAEAKDATGRRLGEGTFHYRGEEVGEAFSKEWNNPIARDQISSEKLADFIFARGESIDMARLIKTGSWTDITPDLPHHMDSWLHALNKQMRQDDLYRLVAQDDTLRSARNWLKTPEGKHHLNLLGPWARDIDGLLNTLKVTLDNYLPKGTGLQEKLARNEEITDVDLRSAIAKEDFPTVHGEEVKATTALNARETARYKVDEIISAGYRFLGAIPSDLLVRHPVFNNAYKMRIREFIDQHKDFKISQGLDETISADEMNKMYERAAKAAKNDIRTVVYDPQRTTATEALRFVFPFLSAHADSLQRWAGMIGEKPQFLGAMAKVYNAPVAANLVTDTQGNHVGQDGYATVDLSYIDPSTGKKVQKSERKFVPIEERVLNLRLPWDTKNESSLAKLPGYGTPISIQAINTILPGDPWFNPGTGPLVQLPASAIAKKSPQIGDFLQWSKVLPYGPSGDTMDIITPKYMRAAWDAYTADDPGNEKYQQAYLDVYNRKVAENYESGKPVDLKEVESEAKHFMFLQALTAWGSPAQTRSTPLTGTPYQFYVDQYKKLQEADPKNANAIFQATYGDQYAQFATSLSKSIGVAPSIAAMATAEEYKDLIDQDPDMASWIVGDTYNGGGFSAAVYRKQMETMMGGKPMREKQSALDAIRQAEVSRGWAEYLKSKGKLDTLVQHQGFRSIDDPGAEPLKQIQKMMVEFYSDRYPQWAKERGQVDTQKIPNRIKFFEKAIMDKRLQSDPMRFDLPAMEQYLIGRRHFKQQLEARGLSKLSFDENGHPSGEAADIGMQWRQYQTMVKAGNTQFTDVFNRYLESDDLQ